jgi:hypothetical protein
MLLASFPAFGQATADRVTVPFSDPSRPGQVKVSLINGSITVKAYNGKEVIIEARSKGRDSEESREGLRRIPILATGIEAEEENNVITIGTGGPQRTVDLDIQVPVRTSLKLSTINGGQILVEGVRGELEVKNINGAVTLNKVAGSAVAHALNGRILATFTEVDPKPMSFSSMNGQIDVTFPADLKATLKLKSEHGEVYSDFDIAVKQAAQPIVEDAKGDRGKYRVRVDRTVHGVVNGGGAEIQFSNFNGSIYIRKAK